MACQSGEVASIFDFVAGIDLSNISNWWTIHSGQEWSFSLALKRVRYDFHNGHSQSKSD